MDKKAGGTGLDVGQTLLELAEDGLIALLAVDVADDLAFDIVLAFAEVSIRGNHHESVVIGTTVIRFDAFRQPPFGIVATRCYLLVQPHFLFEECCAIFRRALTIKRYGIYNKMFVGAKALMQQFHQFSHLPDVVLIDVQANTHMDAGGGQQTDIL